MPLAVLELPGTSKLVGGNSLPTFSHRRSANYQLKDFIMPIHLVVAQPFANYAKGDRITDAETVRKLLIEHSHRVVKVNGADESTPQDTQNG